MFNPLTRIRHRCPFCGTTPFIFEWEGRYMPSEVPNQSEDTE